MIKEVTDFLHDKGIKDYFVFIVNEDGKTGDFENALQPFIFSYFKDAVVDEAERQREAQYKKAQGLEKDV